MSRFLVCQCVLVLASAMLPAEIRTMTANFADEAPVIDGIALAGEWQATQGEWTLLGDPDPEMDVTENRWAAQWDLSGIYLLHEVTYSSWSPLGIDQIDFGYENLQLYFDPNTDNEDERTGRR